MLEKKHQLPLNPIQPRDTLCTQVHSLCLRALVGALLLGALLASVALYAEEPDPPSTRTLPRVTADATAETLSDESNSDAPTQEIICRAAWGARPPRGEHQPHTVTGVMIHHTGVKLDNNREAPARIRAAQVFHQHGAQKSYVDLAYHVMIDRLGNVYEGRPLDARGDTGTGYNPSGFLLVGLMGDFDLQEPTPQQRLSLANVLAWAGHTYGLTTREVTAHKRRAQTACPGANMMRILEDGSLFQDVKARGDVALRSLCGEEGRAKVEAIGRGRP